MTRATVPGVLGRILAIWLGLLAACYSPEQPACGFACRGDAGAGDQCPSGYACASDGICHRIGAPADLTCAFDARPDTPRPIDAPSADADITPPALFETQPVSGDVNVPTSATIRVQFTEAVSGVNATTFAVGSGSAVVAGTVTQVDSTTFAFMPTSLLPANATIQVQLFSGITDSVGNSLGMVSFSFMTGS